MSSTEFNINELIFVWHSIHKITFNIICVYDELFYRRVREMFSLNHFNVEIKF